MKFIPEEILDSLKTIPLFGKAPPIDLERLSLLLKEEFEVDSLSIEMQKCERVEKKEMKEGLGVKPLILPIHLLPFRSLLYVAISKTDQSKLTGALIGESPKKKAFYSPPLEKGFLMFILARSLSQINSLEPIEQMSLELGEKENELIEQGFDVNLEVKINEISILLKLLLPIPFQEEWIQHFAAFPPVYTPSKLSKSKLLKVGIQIGSVALTLSQIQNLKKGDFVILDQTQKEKTGILTYKNTPLFSLTIEGNQAMLQDSFDNQDEHVDNIENEENRDFTKMEVNVQVELASLNMSLDELMKLSSGNVLELPEAVDQTLTLKVNGKKIATAELVQLGDVKGVKIIQI